MSTTKNLTSSALLIALGIIIPMFMYKVTIPPASYTIASHVPVFISMFISPSVAIMVSLGTAFGFFVSLPPVIALRALSHIVFAYLGALYIQKNPDLINKPKQLFIFNILIGLIHATAECLVVILFYQVTQTSIDLVKFVFLMIGVGGFIHSIVDFLIAQVVVKKLYQQGFIN
ncbi:hypothetical protein ERUR111494_08280 [Erysipelothrix urinaevulpis]|uniref:hypothetical protein n=1 Tax=Erysipelothrix urinaevulpis TaxID=2683717 RepID=UPI00191575B5|nr:hypothetical protein [Erysipelothrix urinaevulpis]